MYVSIEENKSDDDNDGDDDCECDGISDGTSVQSV